MFLDFPDVEIPKRQSPDLPNAIKDATAPGFNISAADSQGNIGWHIMGAIPLRPEGVSGRRKL